MPNARAICAIGLPLVCASRTASRFNAGVYVFWTFCIVVALLVKQSIRRISSSTKVGQGHPSSVPLELETIVPTLPITVQPILAASQKREFSMFSSLSTRYHWLLPIYRYADLPSLLATFSEKVLAPAEQKAKELELQK